MRVRARIKAERAIFAKEVLLGTPLTGSVKLYLQTDFIRIGAASSLIAVNRERSDSTRLPCCGTADQGSLKLARLNH